MLRIEVQLDLISVSEFIMEIVGSSSTSNLLAKKSSGAFFAQVYSSYIVFLNFRFRIIVQNPVDAFQ